MIVDTSALIAISRSESDAAAYAKGDRRGARPPHLSRELRRSGRRHRWQSRTDRRRRSAIWCARPISSSSHNTTHARLAREAYRDFGKGT